MQIDLSDLGIVVWDVQYGVETLTMVGSDGNLTKTAIPCRTQQTGLKMLITISWASPCAM
jgi:hypothetical protein